ncbi:hypothetical protein Tco_1507472 [Tanacetum coccineum]
MFDAPVLLPDQAFGDRVGGAAAPPPRSNFYDGLESLRALSRRGPGDDHDNSQLQAGEAFLKFIIFSQYTQHVAEGAEGTDTDTQQSDLNTIYQELNQSVENVEHFEGQSHGSTPNVVNIALDSMEIVLTKSCTTRKDEMGGTSNLDVEEVRNRNRNLLEDNGD